MRPHPTLHHQPMMCAYEHHAFALSSTGMNCVVAGMTLHNLDAEGGYWRADNSSEQFLKCPQPKVCSSTNESNTDPCAMGHTGVLCANCATGYTRWQPTGLCSPCPKEQGRPLAFAIALFMVMGMVYMAFIVFSKHAGAGSLRSVISAAQLLNVLLMYPVEWPELVLRFQDAMSIINLDASIMSPSCLGVPLNYHARFGVMVAGAAFVLSAHWLLVLRHCRSTVEQWHEVLATHVKVSVTLLIILHPTLSGQSFYFFRCQQISYNNGTESKWYMMADYSLECYDSTWNMMLILAIPVVVIFVLGTPFMVLIVLYRHRASLGHKRTMRLVGVFYKSYKERFYYCEVRDGS